MDIHWGVNYRVATCRHVLGDDGLPVCGQSRGRFMELELVVQEEALKDHDRLRGRLIALPVCARCRPIARMRGVGV